MRNATESFTRAVPRATEFDVLVELQHTHNIHIIDDVTPYFRDKLGISLLLYDSRYHLLFFSFHRLHGIPSYIYECLPHTYNKVLYELPSCLPAAVSFFSKVISRLL